MGLTRERKILAGAVGLAACALLVDRVFLGGEAGPEEAEAAAFSDVSAADLKPRPAASNPVVSPSVSEPEGPSLAHRLASITEATWAGQGLSDVADAFATPVSWMPVEQAKQAESTGMSRQDFARKHRLEAVMLGGATGCAIIDGKAVRVGQTLDGFELIELGQRSVAFRGPSGRVELVLEANLPAN